MSVDGQRDRGVPDPGRCARGRDWAELRDRIARYEAELAARCARDLDDRARRLGDELREKVRAELDRQRP